MRKIIVYIATSADGYIARKDGAVDWLDRPRPKGNYGMGEFWKSIDTILLGRKTYDFVVQYQKKTKGDLMSTMDTIFKPKNKPKPRPNPLQKMQKRPVARPAFFFCAAPVSCQPCLARLTRGGA